MKKIDFKKELKYLYNPSAKEIAVVDVPEMTEKIRSCKPAPKMINYKKHF